QIARKLSTAREHYRVECLGQLLRRDKFACQIIHTDNLFGAYTDAHSGAKLHALRGHLFHAPVDEPFLHLEIGNAVSKQSSDSIVLLEQNHHMSGTRELLCTGKSRRTGTNHRDTFAGLVLRWLWCHQTEFPTLVDDGVLDRLDPDGVVVDVKRARFFA